MTDALSQDELDALLRQVQEDLPALDPDDYLSPMQRDALGEIGNITFGSAATALSNLLSQKTDITTPTVGVVLRSELSDEFPQPHVAVDVRYTEGFEGLNLLVIRVDDAKIIADLMMGGAGVVTDEGLSELHISAVQEAMNQMMGSSATAMANMFSRKVDISPPSIDLMDIDSGKGMDKVPKDDVLIKVSFRLKIGDLIDSTIMQLLTVDFAREMVGLLMGDISMDSPTSSTSPSPASSATPTVATPTTTSASSPAPTPTPTPTPKQVQPVAFAPLTPSATTLPPFDPTNLSLLMDIPLQVTAELGRTRRSIKDVLEFSQGSIIELEKLAGEPVDILVNDKLVARGEVVVVEENFGVRITELLTLEERMKILR